MTFDRINHFPVFIFLQMKSKAKGTTSDAMLHHNSYVIMGAMVSQLTGVSIVYSTDCWGAYEKNIKLRVTGLCEGNSPVIGEFPAQRASNAENASIWWRHQSLKFQLSFFNCHLSTVKIIDWIASLRKHPFKTWSHHVTASIFGRIFMTESWSMLIIFSPRFVL